MTTYGYARVSTNGQDLAAQEAELLAAGCAKVFKEKVSGAKTDRAELAKLLHRIESGDVLVVTRLDRLARSTRDLLNVIAALTERGAGFKSLKRHLGRYHHASRPPNVDRSWWLGRIRARVNPCPYRGRQEACEGQRCEIRTACRANAGPTAGSNSEACAGRSTGRCGEVLQCLAGDDLAACSRLTAIRVAHSAAT